MMKVKVVIISVIMITVVLIMITIVMIIITIFIIMITIVMIMITIVFIMITIVMTRWGKKVWFTEFARPTTRDPAKELEYMKVIIMMTMIN